MSPSTIEYLEHIQKELSFLVKHSSITSYEQFLSDGVIKRAYLRSLTIIGKAARDVSEEIRYKYPGVDSSGFIKLRDVLPDQYFQVDYQLVWEAVREDIPKSKEWIETIIEQEKTLKS